MIGLGLINYRVMNKKLTVLCILLSVFISIAFVSFKKPINIYLIGDSTVADYSLEPDYLQKKYPITGWGQVFQSFFNRNSLKELKNIIDNDSVLVMDKAKGGRSTRTFFSEGRWTEIMNVLRKDDLVLIQFGHNDAAKDKPERYIDTAGYKRLLRMYVKDARSKKAKPILITPVTRNYPWINNKLKSAHGDYPEAVKQVAREQNIPLIDLTTLSANFFTEKGKDYVSKNYFMNLDSAKYEAYPNGQKDNTHFQPQGAKEIARLVFEELLKINKK
ncbi:rhamnogalacturonan acetylesterase [Pedobacter aquatilis]|uniref:rhamnogalacturonan acetylesterase n=1 Tax=Pedobacter aquatilis TaxID=351343 RepID=UPI0025B56680|nr:rhamnogalacturonan acetylesterase [Pedobacter aquatilis]MDN3587761.1 rhamnogalacturonan acetylesterase [Pedobacter aquatilis]